MGGSQVFYMGDNGEVLTWDGTTPIDTKPYCVTELETQYPQPCPICRAVGCDCLINGRWRGPLRELESKRWGMAGSIGATGPQCPPSEGNPNLPVGWFFKQIGYDAVQVGCVDAPVDPSVGVPADDRYIDFDIGYAQALRDVLAEIVASGKQNLVQWLEARLKDLP